MVSSGANVIIWCYHVMLSSGMITPPFLFFLETSLTHNGQQRKAGKKVIMWLSEQADRNNVSLFSCFPRLPKNSTPFVHVLFKFLSLKNIHRVTQSL
jgi:hypothetical protein